MPSINTISQWPSGTAPLGAIFNFRTTPRNRGRCSDWIRCAVVAAVSAAFLLDAPMQRGACDTARHVQRTAPQSRPYALAIVLIVLR